MAAYAVLAFGCARAAQTSTTTPTSAALFIPPLKTARAPGPSNVVRFGEGAAPPSGCFALSRRSGAVACLVGQYRAGSAMGERYLSILSSGDDAIPNVSLRVEHVEGGVRLEPGSQRLLDAMMRDGDYITLDPPVVVTADSPRSFGQLSIELHREEIPIASVTRWDLRLVVRADPPPDGDETAGVLLQNTLTSVACPDPTVSVRRLEPHLLLVERECRFDDEADADVNVSAWLCDSDRGRCD